MLNTLAIEFSNADIVDLVMALVAIAVATAYTVSVLKAYGVNKYNHGLFSTFFRLKCTGATADKIGSEVFCHVLEKTSGNIRKAIGIYDITPIRLFDKSLMEEAFEKIKEDILLIEGVENVTIESDDKETCVLLIVE